ncbi:membrane-associated protein, putative [Bodo saltans]|uniref:Membrane-associated protein, putative n=1 Tax=Bodo saltans TaxID=75058 RepID=A0A0S4JHM2_BODSA|nr:membrane-associated protein, putative [Bodo saltans]|eukprot:CUG88955.1 membrane-associated protein, putative [Bodo saltans]
MSLADAEEPRSGIPTPVNSSSRRRRKISAAVLVVIVCLVIASLAHIENSTTTAGGSPSVRKTDIIVEDDTDDAQTATEPQQSSQKQTSTVRPPDATVESPVAAGGRTHYPVVRSSPGGPQQGVSSATPTPRPIATHPLPSLTVQLMFLNASVSIADLSGMTPNNAAALCELFLLGHPKCNMVTGNETMVDCILRYGVDAWTTALQPQCTRSSFWKAFTTELRRREQNKPVASLNMSRRLQIVQRLFDPVMKAHLLSVTRRLSFTREQQQQQPRDVKQPEINESGNSHNADVDDKEATKGDRRSNSRRESTPFPPPLQCSYGPVYPIGFCIPDDELSWWNPSTAAVPAEHDDGPPSPTSYDASVSARKGAPRRFKLWDWYPVLPSYVPYHETKKIQKKLGKRPRFVSGAEDEYLHSLLYRFSRFAWTHARMGVDCQRHYDIIGGGAVPVFPDLRALPARTAVPHLPRTLLADEVFRLPGILDSVPDIGLAEGRVNSEYYYRTFAKQMNFKKLGVVNHTSFDPAAYEHLSDKLLSYAHRFLTCGSVVQYAMHVMLRNVSAPISSKDTPPPRILFIGHPTIDYMTVAVERGLYELGLDYFVVLPLGEHHQDEFHDTHHQDTNSRSDEVRSGEAYDAWRQRRQLTEMYGRNYHVGRRVPPPPVERRIQPSALCSTSLPTTGYKSMNTNLNTTLPGALRRFDIVLISQPLKTFTVPTGTSGGVGGVSLLCEDELAALVAEGVLQVAVLDGGDAAAVLLYRRFARHRFHIFSREAACG